MVKQIKNTPYLSLGTCLDMKFLGRGLKPRLLQDETDTQHFPLHILVFIVLLLLLLLLLYSEYVVNAPSFSTSTVKEK